MIRLEHANLGVLHVEEMTHFLMTAFPDFRVRHRGTGLMGLPWRHVGNDEFYLALTKVSADTGRPPYSDSTGLNHLGWEVTDLDALETRMRAAGFEPNLKEHGHPARRRSYFHDPDGNDWEFVEYRTDQTAERNDYSDAG
jgi:catechol 2,3-dioxygenase-like lactoylglutathione lyase family enzyme